MSRSRVTPSRSLYWVVTAAFLLGQAWATLQYLTDAPRMIAAIEALGYPVYLTKILAVAKLLGMAAIATGLSPTLKEWAYAGFTFDVCGAFASHAWVGDWPAIALLPAGLFVLQLVSYSLWKQLLRRSAVRRRRHFYDLGSEAQMRTS